MEKIDPSKLTDKQKDFIIEKLQPKFIQGFLYGMVTGVCLI